MRLSSFSASSTPVTKRMKNAEASANLCPRCDTEILAPDPSFDCAVCGAKYCLKCTKIPLMVYDEIEKQNIQGFTWHCQGCKTSLPTLQNMDKTLRSMDERNENRLTQIETKLDKLDTKIVDKVKEKVDELKTEVVDELRTDIEKMMDTKIKEYEDQQHRALNIIVYNLTEINDPRPEIRKTKDIENFCTLANEISVPDIEIKTAYRLGPRADGKTRPLRIVLDNKQQRKALLDKSRQISTKSVQFKKVIIARDLTPKQRDESKQLRTELQVRRNAGESVTIRQGKIVKINPKQPHPSRSSSAQPYTMTTERQSPQKRDEVVDTGSYSRTTNQITTSINEPNMDISSILYNDDTIIGGINTQNLEVYTAGATGGAPAHL